MENCLAKNPDINVVYTINEPAAVGAAQALQDGRRPRASRSSRSTAGAPASSSSRTASSAPPRSSTRSRWPQLGVEAINDDRRRRREAGGQPRASTSTTPASRWSPTSRSTGVDSIDHRRGRQALLGLTRHTRRLVVGRSLPGRPRRSRRSVGHRACTDRASRRRRCRRSRSTAASEVVTHRCPRTTSTAEQFAPAPAVARPARPAPAARAPCDQPVSCWSSSFIVFTILNPRFAAPANLSLIFQQVAVIAALAVGQTIVILTAGIDLSVGAIAILSLDGDGGQLRPSSGLPGVLGAAARDRRRAALAGALNGAAGHPAQAAAVHRHPRAR